MERRWYRGDFHVHSQRSHGGELTPGQVVAAAREAGLDFIAITEHNLVEPHEEWQALAGDDLFVIPGREVVTNAGHWLEIDNRFRVVAHPHAPYPSGSFTLSYDGFDAVEVWNGLWRSDLPWNADNEAALEEWGKTGARLPAIGNSDAHLAGQIGTPQTVVLADALETGAILEAVLAGRCWIAESADVDMSFTAGVEVKGVPDGVVSFHTERGHVHSARLPGPVEWPANDDTFVRLEVRHADGRMAAITNPIRAGRAPSLW